MILIFTLLYLRCWTETYKGRNIKHSRLNITFDIERIDRNGIAGCKFSKYVLSQVINSYISRKDLFQSD